MTNGTVRVTFKDQDYFYPAGTTFQKIAEDVMDSSDTALLALENSDMKEMFKTINEDAKVSFLTIHDAAGRSVLLRGICMLLGKTLLSLYGDDPSYKFTVQRSVNRGFYCTLADSSKINDEMIEKVKRGMQQLVEQKIPFSKKQMHTDDAIRLFEERGMEDKCQLLKYRLSSVTNVYELDGYADYFYGYMVDNTEKLSAFSIQRYHEGFVLLISDNDAPFIGDEKLFAVQKKTSLWGVAHKIKNVGELNQWIVSGKAKELVLVQEAYHEQQIAEIARRIAEDNDKRLVMIAGPSSSGKTTFSHRLSTQLSAHGKVPHPIPMDDYFVNRDKTPLDADGKPDFECLEALDVEQFNEDMTALLRGERVELPTYNFKTGKREYNGKYKQLGENDILVIEGIHGLNDKLSYKLPKESKFKIYISALTQLNIDDHNRIPTTDGRLLRRIVRDARTRGTDVARTIDMWPSVRRGETNHIFPHQESADVMFNSSLVYEFAILKIYAEPYLYSVPRSSEAYSESRRLLKFLSYFAPMTPECIPMNSLVREFIGGSCFDV